MQTNNASKTKTRSIAREDPDHESHTRHPSQWSVQLGFDQAELVEGHRRGLICGAQDAVDDSGSSQHPGDMAAQLEVSPDRLQALLDRADMTLANVVRLNCYTTDMDTLLRHFPIVNERFASTGERFATTLLGVATLPAPDLLIAIEATAVDEPSRPATMCDSTPPCR